MDTVKDYEVRRLDRLSAFDCIPSVRLDVTDETQQFKQLESFFESFTVLQQAEGRHAFTGGLAKEALQDTQTA